MRPEQINQTPRMYTIIVASWTADWRRRITILPAVCQIEYGFAFNITTTYTHRNDRTCYPSISAIGPFTAKSSIHFLLVRQFCSNANICESRLRRNKMKGRVAQWAILKIFWKHWNNIERIFRMLIIFVQSKKTSDSTFMNLQWIIYHNIFGIIAYPLNRSVARITHCFSLYSMLFPIYQCGINIFKVFQCKIVNIYYYKTGVTLGIICQFWY